MCNDSFESNQAHNAGAQQPHRNWVSAMPSLRLPTGVITTGVLGRWEETVNEVNNKAVLLGQGCSRTSPWGSWHGKDAHAPFTEEGCNCHVDGAL